jgi:hypothetical protein
MRFRALTGSPCGHRGSDVPLNVIVNHADQRMYAYKDAFKKKHQGAEDR